MPSNAKMNEIRGTKPTRLTDSVFPKAIKDVWDWMNNSKESRPYKAGETRGSRMVKDLKDEENKIKKAITPKKSEATTPKKSEAKTSTGMKLDAPSKNYNVGVSKGGVSFNEAFAHYRKKLGKGKTFTWNGKKYTTNRADDK